MDLTCFQNIPLNTKEYILSSKAHGTFFKIEDILDPKSTLSKSRETEITPYILLEPNGTKLDINSKRKHRKYIDAWKLNSTSLHDSWLTEGNLKLPRRE